MAIGIWQIILILVVVLVLFGAGKLPSVMGDVGKGMKNFKDGLKDGDVADVETDEKTAAANAEDDNKDKS